MPLISAEWEGLMSIMSIVGSDVRQDTYRVVELAEKITDAYGCVGRSVYRRYLKGLMNLRTKLEALKTLRLHKNGASGRGRPFRLAHRLSADEKSILEKAVSYGEIRNNSSKNFKSYARRHLEKLLNAISECHSNEGTHDSQETSEDDFPCEHCNKKKLRDEWFDAIRDCFGF
ncbi:hypothetical protein M413DRAFT_11158 [Hebeloma cylindrosporum]|uniref:Uncharacterized protein n=1 Tax=Hebeloma cylindrosporum TaxID=76867 RepID=A0A0C2XT19_HEBCY|nr:hypothetical protein M413DRAFT_11158 [Hebeloma cylindrosporum h7]